MDTRRSLCKENNHVSRIANTHDSGECSLEKEGDESDKSAACSMPLQKRPTNLQDLVLCEGNLTFDTTEANFSLEDISHNEDIWVLDVPKTIDPINFEGQTIKLGKKNKFQIGNELYETSSVMSNNYQHLSFVLNTGKRKRPYKAVSLKPAGAIRIRQKLPRVPSADFASPEKVCVPFPRSLKPRHPLFGHDYNEKFETLKK